MECFASFFFKLSTKRIHTHTHTHTHTYTHVYMYIYIYIYPSLYSCCNQKPLPVGHAEAILQYNYGRDAEPNTSHRKCTDAQPCNILNCASVWSRHASAECVHITELRYKENQSETKKVREVYFLYVFCLFYGGMI